MLISESAVRSSILPANAIRATTLSANASFVPIGIATVLLGPTLPFLSAQWSLNYLQAGALFSAQFFGATLSTALSGTIIARAGFRFSLALGLFGAALGIGSLPLSQRFAGLACIACYGAGLGLAMPAANLLIASLHVESRSAALSRLNFWWSLGAVLCPLMVAAAWKAGQIKPFLFVLAAVLLLAAGYIATSSSFIDLPGADLPGPEPAEKRKVSRNDPASSGTSADRWASLLLLAALFFLYVGTENAFGGWLASYARELDAREMRGPSLAIATVTPSFFYFALLAGRWVAPAVFRRVAELQAARWSLLAATGGMACLIFSRTSPLVIGSAALAGLGLAAIYPITIAMLAQQFGAAAPRIGSVMFIMANLGGASLPWLVGYSSHRLHSLQYGLLVPLVGAWLMTILFFRARPSSNPPDGIAPQSP